MSFDAFFAESLHHELSHGLGPGLIVVDGRETEVRKELKDLYSVWKRPRRTSWGSTTSWRSPSAARSRRPCKSTIEPTYVAGLFRSARFGVHEAHGRGVISQFNYLLDHGALEIDEEGRFRSVSEVFPTIVSDLLTEMLMLQALGDYEATQQFLDTYGHPRQQLLDAIARLDDVPVDILPLYVTAEDL